MASYKVPQDVEAEDKLIGPFSFRQFIYLIVAAIGILLAWGLGRIFIGLIIIPLPLIAFFLIIALPLRKDQPMETYLAAVIRFFLKPRKRLWVPEGTISLVNITAPKVIARQLTKGFSGEEASQQLSYLADVVDTQGWSTRGVTSNNQGLSDIVVAEAQATVDVFDDNAEVTRALEQRITQADEARRQATLQQFQQAAQQPTQPAPVVSNQPTAAPQKTDDSSLPTNSQQVSFNPYPNDMHQHIVAPAGADDSGQAAAPPVTENRPLATGAATVSPDIMRLANNNDLSISTLANEAHRLQNEEEVEISLR